MKDKELSIRFYSKVFKEGARPVLMIEKTSERQGLKRGVGTKVSEVDLVDYSKEYEKFLISPEGKAYEAALKAVDEAAAQAEVAQSESDTARAKAEDKAFEARVRKVLSKKSAKEEASEVSSDEVVAPSEVEESAPVSKGKRSKKGVA